MRVLTKVDDARPLQVVPVSKNGVDVRVAGGGVSEQFMSKSGKKASDLGGGKLLGLGVVGGQLAEIAFEVGTSREGLHLCKLRILIVIRSKLKSTGSMGRRLAPQREE